MIEILNFSFLRLTVFLKSIILVITAYIVKMKNIVFYACHYSVSSSFKAFRNTLPYIPPNLYY